MDWPAHRKTLVAAAVGAALLWVAFVTGSRVPLLSMFDLGIHELGHLITRPFGIVVSFLMGSGLQILVPLGLAIYFWAWQKDRTASGLLLCWTATAMQDVSVYVADAPYRAIQLIGGTHDWWWLLSRWGKLEGAEELANGLWLTGLLVGVAGLAVIVAPLARILWEWTGDRTPRRTTGPIRVRERRLPGSD